MIFKQLFFTSRFFITGSCIIVLIAVSFVFPWLFSVGLAALSVLFTITLSDVAIMFSKNRGIFVERIIPTIMSLGDENKISLKLRNHSGIKLYLEIFDEIPYQFQKRDLVLLSTLENGSEIVLEYSLTPPSRGKYIFGNINILLKSSLGLILRKKVFSQTATVPVYPSIVQMKKYELKSHPFSTASEGIKKRRRTGQSYEFDQIKEYVIGDDSRSMNWKASSRRGNLMVNQYEDERSQQVYTIIDKSRVMRMPFNNLTLLDYAINTSLVISNIILQKHDKAGLITFSDKIGTILPAERTSRQLKKILEALYNEKEHFPEAEYELLYHLVRNVIKNRSLIFLYTNFESYQSFTRVLPILRQINKLHLLVVMFFENEEVVTLSKQPANKLHEVYVQTMARKYLTDKEQIASDLANHGIHVIKSIPSELSINTINKYLELKSRRMI